MALPFVPRFAYGSGPTVLTLTHPQHPWTPDTEGVGGSETSAAGVPAAFRIRRNQLMTLRLRVLESEWPALVAMVEHGQAAGTISWYPDKDLSTNYVCYLESPALGEKIGHVRDEEMDDLFHVPLVLRRTTEIPFDVRRYP